MTWFKNIGAKLRGFGRDEDGSATVDYVVGTAAGLVLALAVLDIVSEGVTALADSVGAQLAATEIPTY